jgi:hypothetical protein
MTVPGNMTTKEVTMRRMVRAVLAAVLAVGLLGACSAEGGIDTSGDGVKIEGDVDANEP